MVREKGFSDPSHIRAWQHACAHVVPMLSVPAGVPELTLIACHASCFTGKITRGNTEAHEPERHACSTAEQDRDATRALSSTEAKLRSPCSGNLTACGPIHSLQHHGPACKMLGMRQFSAGPDTSYAAVQDRADELWYKHAAPDSVLLCTSKICRGRTRHSSGSAPKRPPHLCSNQI